MSKFTVNEIFRKYGEDYQQNRTISIHEKKVIRAIQNCRTEKMGGRTEVCNHCGHTIRILHSCRNRHCPQCQFMKKEQWIADRKERVFPFQHFHVVFTLPHKLHPLVIRNKRIIYDLLFSKVKETLLSAANEKKYFGARIGFFGILHTWGQKMNLHPHIHCVVPGGGFSGKGWVKSPRNFLLPIPVLKKRFRSGFLRELKELYRQGKLKTEGSGFHSAKDFQTLIDNLFAEEWVIYVKKAFRNSDTVIEYLSRYTHRIAISNHRILDISEDGTVRFSYKDYKDNNSKKEMTLSAEEFIRRFMVHVVPSRYVRIRYFGMMANRNCQGNLENCRRFYKGKKRVIKKEKPDWDLLMKEITGIDVHKCPQCETGQMEIWNPDPPVRERSPPE